MDIEQLKQRFGYHGKPLIWKQCFDGITRDLGAQIDAMNALCERQAKTIDALSNILAGQQINTDSLLELANLSIVVDHPNHSGNQSQQQASQSGEQLGANRYREEECRHKSGLLEECAGFLEDGLESEGELESQGSIESRRLIKQIRSALNSDI